MIREVYGKDIVKVKEIFTGKARIIMINASSLERGKGMLSRAGTSVLVNITAAGIQKEVHYVFDVTVTGTVPTTGWVVDLVPAIYILPPENWEVDAIGIPPSGIVLPMVTPWMAQLRMYLTDDTKRVTVNGIDEEGKPKAITLDVPHKLPMNNEIREAIDQSSGEPECVCGPDEGEVGAIMLENKRCTHGGRFYNPGSRICMSKKIHECVKPSGKDARWVNLGYSCR